MTHVQSFTGFPREAIQFFGALKENNYREWFEERKSDYQEYVLKPAQAFLVALGDRLTGISNEITYDPRTSGSGSIMRIYRDIRFSKDKTPYNTRLRIRFWEGMGEKKMLPGFMFFMDETGGGFLGGLRRFDTQLLEKYRQAIVDEKKGSEFFQLVDEIKKIRGYSVGGEHYKRVPRGYDTEHPRSDLLRFNAIHLHSPKITASALKKPSLVDTCYEHATQMAPIHHWLVRVNNE